MRVLILGGTGFIGPHMVRALQANGHEITLFNRWRTNTHLFPEVEKLVGDRAGPLDALRGQSWDVVIDNSGYYPEHVSLSATTLADQAEHYIFTSTTDVYRDYDTPGMTEDYPLGVLPEGEPHNPQRWYGQLKVICEHAVREAFPGRNTVIRPTWVIGPGDTNHLWTYWVVRTHAGGEVLAPGRPENPIQWIDVRDIADFVTMRAERRDGGTFHLVAPPTSMAEMLYGIRATTSAEVGFTWVDEDFLWQHGARPWVEFPLWWPARNDYGEPVFGGIKGGEGSGLLDGSHARAAGLEARPLADIAFDVAEWYEEAFGDWPDGQRPGLTRAREAELIDLWMGRGG
ncbi:MAG: NAD-dependent epimerase/dehydratase family protein [Gemmatimonadota bacterium]|nr:NAD-dependent epimerase/dehydratase family protein [Gemmatimonadota bacterium]